MLIFTSCASIEINMGYDAFVKCNCYKDGNISSRPPFEEFVKEDEESIWLDLDWESNKDKHEAFDSWKYSNPCEHDEMEISSERLANSSGMTAFRGIIKEFGEEKYPILSEHLLKINSRKLPIEYVDGMQQELENMKLETFGERLIVLIELTTHQRIASTNANYELPFVFTGFNKLNYKISKDGFKVVRNRRFFGKEYSSEIFTSKRFTQKKIADKKYLFADVNSGKIVESEINLYSDKDYNDDFFEFEIKEKSASIADEYAYIIEPLIKLTKASQKTGNPIIWC